MFKCFLGSGDLVRVMLVGSWSCEFVQAQSRDSNCPKMQELRRSHQDGQGVKHIAAVVNCKQHVKVRVRSKS